VTCHVFPVYKYTFLLFFLGCEQRNKPQKLYLKKQNWLRFLFIVKAADKYQQLYPQILSTEASWLLHDKRPTDITVMATAYVR